MPKKIIYPQDKIIRSRPWKWITIVATILGIVTAGWFFYDKLTEEKYTIEQSVDPETMKRLKELSPGETINVEKGRPADGSE